MTELVLIRGLPGSGKSTMARVLAQVGYVHLEADQFFETEDGYDFRAEDLPAAHAWCLATTELALSEGRRVVVANTFTQLCEMYEYWQLAERFTATLRVLEARGNFRCTHRVPGYMLARMRSRWEEYDQPAEAPDLRFRPPVRKTPILRPVR